MSAELTEDGGTPHTSLRQLAAPETNATNDLAAKLAAALCTERLSCWVRRIGVEAGKAPILHRCHRAAARDAQTAVAGDSLRVGNMSHGLLPPMIEGARIK